MTDDILNEKIDEFRKLISQRFPYFLLIYIGIPNLTVPSIYHTPNPVSFSVDSGKRELI